MEVSTQWNPVFQPGGELISRWFGRRNVQVFLKPRVLPGGALELSSPPGSFGDDGAYVVVEDRGRTHATRAPIRECFRVYLDREGVLRTDHRLSLWSAPVVRLHDKLVRGNG